jgi:SecD/SecF fusion protein
MFIDETGWYANTFVNLLFFWDSSKFSCSILPGIAGIVLTMGTAVDANIIIYERARKKN